MSKIHGPPSHLPPSPGSMTKKEVLPETDRSPVSVVDTLDLQPQTSPLKVLTNQRPAASHQPLSRSLANPTAPANGLQSPTLRPPPPLGPSVQPSLLVTTQSNDDVLALQAHYLAQGKQVVLVDSPQTLTALKHHTRVDNTNQLIQEPGKLLEILQGGGVLIIDTRHWSNFEIEGLNSLFGTPAIFDGITLNNNVQITACIPHEHLTSELRSDAFVSRFGAFAQLSEVTDTPAAAVNIPTYDLSSNGTAKAHLELHGSPRWRGALLGEVRMNEKGALSNVAGSLRQALEAGKDGLVLHNAPWQDLAFCAEINAMMRTRQVHFGQETIALPEPFQIMRADGYAQQETQNAQANCTFIASDAPSSGRGTTHVLNGANFAQAFSTTSILDNQILVRDGFLKQLSANDTLHIVSNLTDAQWRMLLHSGHKLRIAIDPGIVLPPFVEALSPGILAGNAEAPRQISVHPFDTINRLAAGRSAVVRADDASLCVAQLQRLHPQAKVFYAGLETTAAEIIEDIRPIPGTRQFARTEKPIWQDLAAGKTVIIAGLSHNPDLRQSLATLLADPPYAVINGVRQTFKGRLIVIDETVHGMWQMTSRANVIAPPAPDYFPALQREFPFLTPARFANVMQVANLSHQVLAKVPGGTAQRVTFEQLRTMMRAVRPDAKGNVAPSGWQRAFNEVLLAPYKEREATQEYSFLKVAARLLLDESPQEVVNESRLERIIAEAPSPDDARARIWEISSCFSAATLKELWQTSRTDSAQVLPNFHEPRFADAILAAAASHLSPSASAERLAAKPKRTPSQQWESRLDKCVGIFEHSPALFLQGPPGAGKSYIAHEIAARLGADTTLFGPINMGPHTRQRDLVRDIEANGIISSGTLTRFAQDRSAGKKVLVIDEANLTEDRFWEMFRGAFASPPFIDIQGERLELTADHKILFTGNSCRLPGRKTQTLVREAFVTVPFPEQSPAFLADRIITPNLAFLPEAERSGAIELLGRLHANAKHLLPNAAFSPRDIQEVARRMAASKVMPLEQRIVLCWEQVYLGRLTSPERTAVMRDIAHTLDLPLQAPSSKTANQTVATIRQKNPSIALTESTIAYVQRLSQSIDIREHGLKTGHGNVPGKNAMLIEGPAGRGKDAILIQTLLARGYKPGTPDKTSADPQHTFYILNGGLGFSELQRCIKQARAEGSLVIIQEMNLVPSQVLEGLLNDALTGTATAGFSLYATVNPDNFPGRSAMSEALLNRMVCERLESYSADELRQISSTMVSPKQAELLVQYHMDMRARLVEAGKRTEPTPREILRAARLVGQGSTVKQAQQEVYAKYNAILGNAASTGSPLLSQAQRDNTQVCRTLGRLGAQRGDINVVAVNNPYVRPCGALNMESRTVLVDVAAPFNVQQEQALLQGAIIHYSRVRPQQMNQAWQVRLETLRVQNCVLAAHRQSPFSTDVEKKRSEATETLLAQSSIGAMETELKAGGAHPADIFASVMTAIAEAPDEMIPRLRANADDFSPRTRRAVLAALSQHATVQQLLQAVPHVPTDAKAVASKGIAAAKMLEILHQTQVQLRVPEAVADAANVQSLAETQAAAKATTNATQAQTPANNVRRSSIFTNLSMPTIRGTRTLRPPSLSDFSNVSMIGRINAPNAGPPFYMPRHYYDTLDGRGQLSAAEMPRRPAVATDPATVLGEVTLNPPPRSHAMFGNAYKLLMPPNATAINIETVPPTHFSVTVARSGALKINTGGTAITQVKYTMVAASLPTDDVPTRASQSISFPTHLAQLWPQLHASVVGIKGQSAMSVADKVHAIENAFRNQGIYDASPEVTEAYNSSPHSNVIQQFLAIRRGVCRQYAQAFAAVVREELGLPTRVVGGYFTSQDKIGSMTHAWVEVYVANQGWTQCDPTATQVEARTAAVLPSSHSNDEASGVDVPNSPADLQVELAQAAAAVDASRKQATRVHPMSVALSREAREHPERTIARLAQDKPALFTCRAEFQEKHSTTSGGELDIQAWAAGEAEIFVTQDNCSVLTPKHIVIDGSRWLSSSKHTRYFDELHALLSAGAQIDVYLPDGAKIRCASVGEIAAALNLADRQKQSPEAFKKWFRRHLPNADPRHLPDAEPLVPAGSHTLCEYRQKGLPRVSMAAVQVTLDAAEAYLGSISKTRRVDNNGYAWFIYDDIKLGQDNNLEDTHSSNSPQVILAFNSLDGGALHLFTRSCPTEFILQSKISESLSECTGLGIDVIDASTPLLFRKMPHLRKLNIDASKSDWFSIQQAIDAAIKEFPLLETLVIKEPYPFRSPNVIRIVGHGNLSKIEFTGECFRYSRVLPPELDIRQCPQLASLNGALYPIKINDSMTHTDRPLAAEIYDDVSWRVLENSL